MPQRARESQSAPVPLGVSIAQRVGNPGREGTPQVAVTATTSTRYALAASPRSTSWYKEEGL